MSFSLQWSMQDGICTVGRVAKLSDLLLGIARQWAGALRCALTSHSYCTRIALIVYMSAVYYHLSALFYALISSNYQQNASADAHCEILECLKSCEHYLICFKLDDRIIIMLVCDGLLSVV